MNPQLSLKAVQWVLEQSDAAATNPSLVFATTGVGSNSVVVVVVFQMIYQVLHQ